MPTRPTPPRRPAPVRLLAAAAALSALLPAAQAETSPWYVGAGISYGHDSNLLRLADGVQAPEGYSKSDQILSTSLLGGLDQPIGRQRVYGNAVLRDNRYADNSLYNNQSYAVSMGLNWETVERLSGTLSGSASRQLSSFDVQEVGLLQRKNQESVRSIDGSLRWGLASLFTLEAAAGQRRVSNSLDDTRIQARNYTQDVASLGVAWRPGATTSVGLGYRQTRGRYPRFGVDTDGAWVADRFDRKDIDLTATLQPSGASQLDLRLSSGKTEYDLNSQRDFSGVTGSLGWTWQATGKLRLTTRLARDTGQDSYAFNLLGLTSAMDYSRITNSLSVRTDYAVSAKVAANLNLNYADRDLVRTLPSIFGNLEATGRERYTGVALGLTWQPLRSLSVGCNLGNDTTRGSGALGTSLKSTSLSCFGQFIIQ